MNRDSIMMSNMLLKSLDDVWALDFVPPTGPASSAGPGHPYPHQGYPQGYRAPRAAGGGGGGSGGFMSQPPGHHHHGQGVQSSQHHQVPMQSAPAQMGGPGVGADAPFGSLLDPMSSFLDPRQAGMPDFFGMDAVFGGPPNPSSQYYQGRGEGQAPRSTEDRNGSRYNSEGSFGVLDLAHDVDSLTGGSMSSGGGYPSDGHHFHQGQGASQPGPAPPAPPPYGHPSMPHHVLQQSFAPQQHSANGPHQSTPSSSGYGDWVGAPKSMPAPPPPQQQASMFPGHPHHQAGSFHPHPFNMTSAGSLYQNGVHPGDMMFGNPQPPPPPPGAAAAAAPPPPYHSLNSSQAVSGGGAAGSGQHPTSQ